MHLAERVKQRILTNLGSASYLAQITVIDLPNQEIRMETVVPGFLADRTKKAILEAWHE
jgi:hypothetical protein